MHQRKLFEINSSRPPRQTPHETSDAARYRLGEGLRIMMDRQELTNGKPLPVSQQTTTLDLVFKFSQRAFSLGNALTGLNIKCPFVLGAGECFSL